MNKEFIKDLSRSIKNSTIQQELSPGSTSRRYEPIEGVNKLNNRIHKESSYADTHKNLPFTFRKPFKSKGRSTYVKCSTCGHILSGTTATVGVICPACKKFSSVTEVCFDG